LDSFNYTVALVALNLKNYSPTMNWCCAIFINFLASINPTAVCLAPKTLEQPEKPVFYSETTVKPRWELNSWQRLVIKAIIEGGCPLTWKELQKASGLDMKALNRAIFDLHDADEIYKFRNDAKEPYRYQLVGKVYEKYPEFCSPKTRLLRWIVQWKEVKGLAFSLEHEHFFLEGRHLDDFSKELIAHARSNVLVANPFIQDCDLSNTLSEAKRNGINVQIITRVPKDSNPEYLKKKQEYHSLLKGEGISLVYSKKVHAKIIVVDHTIAVVGSMNFYANSSAGVSWEVGLVSADSNVVMTIVKTFLNMLAKGNAKGTSF
jgi:hypothetical protein